MSKKSMCGAWAAVLSLGVFAVGEPGGIEEIRADAVRVRTTHPGAPVFAGGTALQAERFAATGEAEEIDAWRLTEKVDSKTYARVRAAFDAAGGKAVRLLRKAHCSGRTSSSLLLTGTDRVFMVDERGATVWEKRGCGNVHRAVLHDTWVYYSNGSLWRVSSLDKDPFQKPQLVYEPDVAAGGGVLGFDVVEEGNVVCALNSTCEVVELDSTGREQVRFKVDARDADGKMPPPHGRLRMIRKTRTGTYVVCCATAHCVREYTARGKLVRSQDVPVFAFDAVPLASGNWVCSHLTGVTEYTVDGAVARHFDAKGDPRLRLENLCGLAVRENGHLLVGTWANGSPEGVRTTAFEVDRAGNVVWLFCATEDVNMMGVSF